MAGYWDEVGRSAAGALEEVPLVNWFVPDKWSQPQFPTRPALGAESARAAKEQAMFYKNMMNRSFMNTTMPAINREFAGAGRFQSGQRMAAMGQAGNQMQTVLGDLLAKTAMDRYRTDLGATLQREGMDESRAFNQAQLDSQGGMDWGAIMQAIMMMQGGG